MSSSESTLSLPGTNADPAAIQYRPDIDGMRGVAVIAVILFHASPDICPGGFMGVDAFFVISGFLITGIILTGLSRGEFSFAGFYSRRIRRIAPALSAVLVFCLAIGWWILIPGEWRELGKDVEKCAGFVSNLLEPGEGGYFDFQGGSQPLRHLWSLAIEEQFYLVWPLTLVLLWKLGERTKPKRTDFVLAGILLMALISFALNVQRLYRYPDSTFYSPLTRAWELLAGAILARIALVYGQVKRRVHRELLSVPGVILFATGLVVLSANKPFPGWRALLPVLGAVFLITAGAEAWFNRRVLAARPLVAVGLISYPLYLWHWPLLVFMRLALRDNLPLTAGQTAAMTIAVLILAVVLSWATYRFWEKPMRFSTSLTSAFRVRLLIAAMAGAAVLGTLSLSGVPPRLNSPVVRELERAKADSRYMGNWKMQPLRNFEFRSLSTQATLLVGDSHMEQFVPRVEAVIKANPRLATAVFATSGLCPPLPGMNADMPSFQCPAFYDYWMALAREDRFSTIAISALWEGYEPLDYALHLTFHAHRATAPDYDEAWRGLAKDLRSLVNSGKRVVIFTSTPAWLTFDPELGFGRVHTPGFQRLSSVPRATLEKYLATVNHRINEAAQYSGAEIISPRDYLCNDNECPALDTDGTPLYRDNNHLRASKVGKVATFVDDVLRPR